MSAKVGETARFIIEKYKINVNKTGLHIRDKNNLKSEPIKLDFQEVEDLVFVLDVWLENTYHDEGGTDG